MRRLHHSIHVEAHTSQLAVVRQFIVSRVGDSDFSEKDISDVTLAVDEAFTNIIRHAYPEDAKKTGKVEILLSIENDSLTVSLVDHGKRFNPDELAPPIPVPDIRRLSQQKMRGGLGVFLIHRLMDDVQYRSGGRMNEIRMKKVKST